MTLSLSRRIAAEFLGTLFLLAAVVGSGIMGERLAAGNIALALLANSIATGAALVALILTFSGISGAHFNPVVTLSDAWRGGIAWRLVPRVSRSADRRSLQPALPLRTSCSVRRSSLHRLTPAAAQRNSSASSSPPSV